MRIMLRLAGVLIIGVAAISAAQAQTGAVPSRNCLLR